MSQPGYYPPSHHVVHDPGVLVRFIETLRLATLISVHDDDIEVAFVPMLVEYDAGSVVLFGHIDAVNPKANQLDGRRMHAVFHGPQSYISPDDYGTPQLPTWNYAHVVAAGTVRELANDEQKRGLLVRMAETFGGPAQAFVLEKSDQRMAGMLDGIRAFRIDVDRLVGRFKLSQDKSAADANAALAAMLRKSVERECAVVALIEETELLP